MDCKITNFDVTTEQTRLEQMTEIPLDSDFSLADYFPDIKRILKCIITPYVSNKQISTNVLTIEGEAVLCVIYCDQDDNIVSAEEEIPFRKSFEASGTLDGGSARVTATATVHSCRAVTERKISCKSSVKLQAQVTLLEKTSIVSDAQLEGFEQLCGNAPAVTPLGTAEQALVIEEEISFPSNMPASLRVIRNEAFAYVTECKIISNKIMVKGNMCVCIVYCSVDNTIEHYNASIPFNQILELPGVTEMCECDAECEICGFNLTLRTNQDGECREFIVTGKITVTARARCTDNIPVLYDAYSTKFATKIKRDEVSFHKIIKQINESFLCRKTISLPEGSTEKVLDLWCRQNGCICRSTESGIVISGSITVNAITKSASDETNFYEHTIDFEYPIELNSDKNQPWCHPKIDLAHTDYALQGSDNIEVKTELRISAAIYDSSGFSLITEISADENQKIECNDVGLIAYYADEGENLWDISKNFSANRKEFLELNEIKDETLTSPRMLLIPRF